MDDFVVFSIGNPEDIMYFFLMKNRSNQIDHGTLSFTSNDIINLWEVLQGFLRGKGEMKATDDRDDIRVDCFCDFTCPCTGVCVGGEPRC